MEIGIDLGTSYVKIGTLDQDGAFINLLGPGGMMPAVAAYSPRDGRLCFGEEAERLDAPGVTLWRFFKLAIKRSPHLALGPWPLGEVVAGFLRHVRRCALPPDAAVSQVATCIPNYFGLQARRLVLEAVRDTFPGAAVQLLPEPLAAMVGLLQARRGRQQPPLTGSWMVVDVGGGTADASIVDLGGAGGSSMVLEAQLQTGSDAFSGAEVDKALLRRVLVPLFEAHSGVRVPVELMREQQPNRQEACCWARMLWWAEQVKLRLLAEGHAWVDIPDFYGGRPLRAELDRAELALAAGQPLQQLQHFLESRVKPRAAQLGLVEAGRWALDGIVLLGGASRFPGVRDVLAATGCRVEMPEDPEFYVVQGLCWMTRPESSAVRLRSLLPLRFLLERWGREGQAVTVLEPIPFDFANLELEHDRSYRLCTVPFESPYNLATVPGRFRLRVWQALEDEQAREVVLSDAESLVLDRTLEVTGMAAGAVDLCLDLGESQLVLEASLPATSSRGGAGRELWPRVLEHQSRAAGLLRELKGPARPPQQGLERDLAELREEGEQFANYDRYLTGKLLAVFDLLSRRQREG